MNKSKKNIESFFQEKLSDFEVTPNPKVWNTIEDTLQKKKRNVLPIWWYFGGVAAILLVSILLYPHFSEKPIHPKFKNTPTIVTIPQKNTLVDSIKKELKEIPITSSKIEVVTTEKKQQVNNKPISKTTKKILPKNKVTKSIVSEKKIAQIKKEKPTIKKDIKKTISMTKRSDSSKKRKEKLMISTLNSTDKEIITNTKNKWSITPVMGFLNARSFSNSSPLDKELISNPTVGSNSISYGIKIGYSITKNWALQSGIYLQNLNYLTKNLAIASNIGNSYLSNLHYSNPQEPFTIISARFGDTASVLNGVNLLTNEATLDQRIGYIEVPIEIKYSFINGARFRTKIIAGVSSLFLSENKISVTSPLFSKPLGKANNLNSLNFSSNLGLDVDFSLSKSLKLNLNPMFKVQLNTFSKNSNGFKPYTIGLYTGINYQF